MLAITIVILAAGKSVRMHSKKPKAMHQIAERPMLGYVLETVSQLRLSQVILVTSPEMDEVRHFAQQEYPNIIHSIQEKALGTGDAVKTSLDKIKNIEGSTIILYGDTPFVTIDTIKRMNAAISDNNSVAVVGFIVADPKQYGRLIKINDQLVKIVEFADASDDEKEIGYCNSGIIAIDNLHLHNLVNAIQDNNMKGEFYLTDIVNLAVLQGLSCTVIDVEHEEVLGINNRHDLDYANQVMQRKIKQKLMDQGVTFLNSETSYIAYDLQVGKDVTIYPNVFIGKNIVLGNEVNIYSFSHIEGATIGDKSSIGPFARIRPHSKISEQVRVGNFVEIKNATINKETKINHLSYIGDTTIGMSVNIGAGVITCNFDGISRKSYTIIGDNVSVGSNSALIAPVEIGKSAFIAAGSVITRDVGENDLAFGRAKQVNLKQKAKSLRNNIGNKDE